jgi:hypothetical protein
VRESGGREKGQLERGHQEAAGVEDGDECQPRGLGAREDDKGGGEELFVDGRVGNTPARQQRWEHALQHVLRVVARIEVSIELVIPFGRDGMSGNQGNDTKSKKAAHFNSALVSWEVKLEH